jgi:hypothetical protein
MAREVNQLLCRVFAQRRKDGRTDLEAVAGAAALTELLQFEAPAADQRQLPCRCGHHAQYQEIRCKPILTIVGPVRIARPYYLCSQCHVGQFPVDVELDIEKRSFLPGCAACMRWWVKRPRSITAASSCNFWPACR